MGYNTVFNLEIEWPKDPVEIAVPGKLFPLIIKNEDDILEYLQENPNIVADRFCIEEFLRDGSFYGKWYDYDDDMKLLSKTFPSILFIVYGDGEDGEDLWKAYYKNGKSQKSEAIIVYEEFDERKLK